MKTECELIDVRQAVVISHFPWPPDSGDPVRVLELIRALDEAGDTDFLIVERDDTTAEHRLELERIVQRGTIRTFRPWWRGRRQGAWKALRLLIVLTTRKPPWIVARYSTELATYLRGNAGSYQRLIAIGEASGVYATLAGGPWHWDKANVLTESTRTARTTSHGRREWLRLQVEYLTSRAFEKSVRRHVSSVSLTSDQELSRWRALAKGDTDADLSVLASAVPVSGEVQLDDDPVTIAWLGSFSYGPNVRGLLRFLEAADEEFTQSGTRLRLIGSGCPPELKSALAEIPFVDNWGYVEDLSEALSGVTAAVVPVWEGAGIKMQTLTLLSFGVPVASTECGAEGIERQAFLVVSDDADELIHACCGVNLAPDVLDQAARGRRICLEQHSSVAFRRAAAKIFDAPIDTRSESFDPPQD
jgi:hypothetical protein